MSSRCLAVCVLALAAAAACARPATPEAQAFEFIEATIPEMREAMEQGRLTSRQLVQMYLARIGMYQPMLRAVVYVNANALKDADERDRERTAGRVRGPLHGIPIALKDNIHTTSMPTSGGALAFDGFIPPYEATLTKNLIAAGAIILAKTTLSELAGYTAGAPTPAPGNYNAVSGQGFNPYDPRRDPRPDTADGRPALTPAGSSSGSGTAANLWAASVGTETSGSILGPSNVSMLAAVKPTVGRISRWGVIPITADQDSAGPMARTVTDAAILLGVLEGTTPDPNDDATTRCAPPPGNDYTPFLKPDALRGARIGIPRAFYYDKVTVPFAKEPRGGLSPAQAQAMNDAIEILIQQGAVIVDPADIPSVLETDPSKTILDWSFCGGAGDVRGNDAHCTIVVKYGMKRDFNKWLATLGPTAPVKTLTELREWNLAHLRGGAIRYGQSRLDISDEVDLEKDRPRYEADMARDLLVSTTNGIDAVMTEHQLDALLFPGSSGAGIAARPGYPSVMVPFAMVPNEPTPPFPTGFDAKPAPYGVSFTGAACSEPRLLGLAYAFEQVTRRRVPPAATP
ncbi:MAG TPA: amidase family protein [Vicinamibacterales bacterium]|nr:amidase family protein [Vicinamibacterales bacterium]